MPHIDGYSFGEIVIDGRKYTRDVIVLPEGVLADWWRREGHSLYPEDLDKVIEARPEVLVVGRGSSAVLEVPEATRRWIEDQGIEFTALPTPEAVETYNALSGKRKVAAGFHLTC